MESPERPTIIYALTDPDTGEVRYIGQTRKLWQRYAQHLLVPRGTSAKLAWLKDLESKRKLPGLRILESVPEDEGSSAERRWIRHWRSQGTSLLNYSPPSVRVTRWNLWLPVLLQGEISRIAAERGISPSQLVKEWLWEKLQTHRPSTP
jgi:hypothetical protein